MDWEATFERLMAKAMDTGARRGSQGRTSCGDAEVTVSRVGGTNDVEIALQTSQDERLGVRAQAFVLISHNDWQAIASAMGRTTWENEARYSFARQSSGGDVQATRHDDGSVSLAVGSGSRAHGTMGIVEIRLTAEAWDALVDGVPDTIDA